MIPGRDRKDWPFTWDLPRDLRVGCVQLRGHGPEKDRSPWPHPLPSGQLVCGISSASSCFPGFVFERGFQESVSENQLTVAAGQRLLAHISPWALDSQSSWLFLSLRFSAGKMEEPHIQKLPRLRPVQSLSVPISQFPSGCTGGFSPFSELWPKGQGCSSVVQGLPGVCKALGPIQALKKQR
jgi:hypothetical protein